MVTLVGLIYENIARRTRRQQPYKRAMDGSDATMRAQMRTFVDQSALRLEDQEHGTGTVELQEALTGGSGIQPLLEL